MDAKYLVCKSPICVLCVVTSSSFKFVAIVWVSLAVEDRNFSRLYKYSSLGPDGPFAAAIIDAAYVESSKALFENAGLSGVPV